MHVQVLGDGKNGNIADFYSYKTKCFQTRLRKPIVDVDITHAPVPTTRSSTTSCPGALVRQRLEGVSIDATGDLLRERLTIHTRPDRIPGLVDEHAGIVSKTNDRSILPLQLLLDPDDHTMANISAADLVRKRGCGGSLGPGGSLLLHDDDYPVTCTSSSCQPTIPPPLELFWVVGGLTDGCGPLLLEDVDALDHRRARVVDAGE